MAQSIKLGNDTFLDAQGINGYKGSLDSSDNLDNMYMRHHSGIYYLGANVQNSPASEVGEVDTKPYRKACEDFSKKEK